MPLGKSIALYISFIFSTYIDTHTHYGLFMDWARDVHMLLCRKMWIINFGIDMWWMMLLGSSVICIEITNFNHGIENYFRVDPCATVAERKSHMQNNEMIPVHWIVCLN